MLNATGAGARQEAGTPDADRNMGVRARAQGTLSHGTARQTRDLADRRFPFRGLGFRLADGSPDVARFVASKQQSRSSPDAGDSKMERDAVAARTNLRRCAGLTIECSACCHTSSMCKHLAIAKMPTFGAYSSVEGPKAPEHRIFCSECAFYSLSLLFSPVEHSGGVRALCVRSAPDRTVRDRPRVANAVARRADTA